MEKAKYGKIYKIYSPQTDQIYIGSTFLNMSKRFGKHKTKYECYKKGLYHYISSFDILKYGDSYYEVLDRQKYNNKESLRIKENEFMEMYKNNIVNIRKAIKE